MIRSKLSLAALAVSAAVFAGVGSAHAATVLKSGGSPIDGWKITFPADVTLIDEGGGTLTLAKAATFNSAEGLDITFTQVGTTTVSPTITFASETITNNSGSAFNSFQFLLQNTFAGSSSNAVFSGTTFTNTGVFTTTTPGSDTITLSGGTLANGATTNFGGTDGGSLVINANPVTTGTKVIDFKEIPGPGPTGVPIPAAAWTGLSGLLGLGLISKIKGLKKLA